MNSRHIVDSLSNLFDHLYVDEAGRAKGGDNKISELGSQRIVKAMNLGNRLLLRIFGTTATILHARYPQTIEEEESIDKVDDIWKMVQSENPHLQDSLELEKAMKIRIINTDHTLRIFPVWADRRTGKTEGWMEKIFEAALNDPKADWVTGSANIMRSLSRAKSKPSKRSTIPKVAGNSRGSPN